MPLTIRNSNSNSSYFIPIIILYIFFFYAYLLFTLFLNFYDKKEGFTQGKFIKKKPILAADTIEALD